MVRSAVKPDVIWLRKTSSDNKSLTLRVRFNIKDISGLDENKEYRTEYEYDEEEIAYVLPDNVVTEEQITSKIQSESASLVQQAKAKAAYVTPAEVVIPEPIGLKALSLEKIRTAISKVTIK